MQQDRLHVMRKFSSNVIGSVTEGGTEDGQLIPNWGIRNNCEDPAEV